jgi:hypothetical protein
VPRCSAAVNIEPNIRKMSAGFIRAILQHMASLAPKRLRQG